MSASSSYMLGLQKVYKVFICSFLFVYLLSFADLWSEGGIIKMFEYELFFGERLDAFRLG